ncbi:hypothetical protein DFQ26_002652, partial [Actinomortierella ambigua]
MAYKSKSRTSSSFSSRETYRFLASDEACDLDVARSYRDSLTLHPPSDPVQDYVRDHRRRAQLARVLGIHPPVSTLPATNCSTHTQVHSYCQIHRGATHLPNTVLSTTTSTTTIVAPRTTT